MRAYATSDLHADFQANRALVETLSETEHLEDLLVVAGDIGHRLELICEVLMGLRRRFARVFFVPGNHDLWVRGAEGDSISRFEELLERCRDLGVDTAPGRVGPVQVVPLFSWYEPALDGGGEVPRRWADQRHCRWPAHVASPAEYFASLNEPRLRALQIEELPCSGSGSDDAGSTSGESPVQTSDDRACLTITCSHFLPRRDLLPPDPLLRYAALPKVAGTPRLERQLRAAGADIHVFGHSHIRLDEVIDGVRYVQHSLAYPRERREPRPVLKQIG